MGKPRSCDSSDAFHGSRRVEAGDGRVQMPRVAKPLDTFALLDVSNGSAAGVALMGQAGGVYTFGAHLRWSWAVARRLLPARVGADYPTTRGTWTTAGTH